MKHLRQTATTLLLIATLASTAHSQSAIQAQTEPGAYSVPITVRGFRSESATSRAQVNICTDAQCVPGSKVSYILSPPVPKPDFERFKATRAQLQRSMEQRLAPGARISFAPPLMTQDGTAMLFEARRTETLLDGRGTTVITRKLYTKRMALEVVSTATNPQVAETNLALFQTSLMALAISSPSSSSRTKEY